MPAGSPGPREDDPFRGALRELLDARPYMERLLNELAGLVPAAEASAVGFAGETGRIVFTHASGLLRGFIGASVDGDASLSGHAMATGTIQWSDDAPGDPRTDRALMARIGMRSLIVVPLCRQGVPFGVLQVLASRPFAFSEADRATCGTLADVVPAIVTASAELARTAEILESGTCVACAPAGGADDALARFVAQVLRPGATAQLAARQRVVEILDARSFRIAFQPIVDLASGTTVAFEALARFDDGSPEPYFAEAASAGLGTDLELAAVEMALRALEELPEPLALTLNVGPEALASDGLAALLAGRGHRVALELTEHAPVKDYTALADALAGLRGLGVRLSVDDTGAGFASLSHIVRLSPEIVKLDRWIIEGAAGDRVRRSLIAALVGFAHDLGAKVVGEGIETSEELRVLQELGVEYGQGFFLGRPGPLADHLRRAHRGCPSLPTNASAVPCGPAV